MTRWSKIRWKEKWGKSTLNYWRTRTSSFPQSPHAATQLWASGQMWAHEAAVKEWFWYTSRHYSDTSTHTQAHTPVSWRSLRSYPNACGCSPGSLWGQTWRRLWSACAGVGYSLPWWRRNDTIPLEANNSPPTVPGFVVLGSIWGRTQQGQKWLCIYLLLQMSSHAGLNNKVFQLPQSNNCDKNILYEEMNNYYINNIYCGIFVYIN